jgi:tetratricopeptide (TPR) repeat protein
MRRVAKLKRFRCYNFSHFASIDHNITVNMVKERPNQTASLIATNNDAVVYLSMGELNESYSLLSEAVATLQKMIREQPPPPTKSSPVRYKFQWNDLTYSNANYVFESYDQNGLPFLFQRCLTIDMPGKREIRANKLCPFGLCPILHYNLALVTHLLGIRKAEYGKSYLQEASRLYSLATADVQSRGRSAGYAMLLMGIWNNQGCIYVELGMEEHQATQCLDRLRKILMSARASINELPGWRYLYLNLVILEKQRSVAAAA